MDLGARTEGNLLCAVQVQGSGALSRRALHSEHAGQELTDLLNLASTPAVLAPTAAQQLQQQRRWRPHTWENGERCREIQACCEGQTESMCAQTRA